MLLEESKQSERVVFPWEIVSEMVKERSTVVNVGNDADVTNVLRALLKCFNFLESLRCRKHASLVKNKKLIGKY